MQILAMDMGWSKSVACLLDTKTGAVSYQRLPTGREPFAVLIQQKQADLVVIEAGQGGLHRMGHGCTPVGRAGVRCLRSPVEKAPMTKPK